MIDGFADVRVVVRADGWVALAEPACIRCPLGWTVVAGIDLDEYSSPLLAANGRDSWRRP